MAVTTVNLDFTYYYDSVVGVEGEGTETNPSTQVGLDTLDTYASSVLEMESEGGFATIPLLRGALSLAELAMEGGLQTSSVGEFDKNVLEIQMEGSLITQGVGHGSASVLEVQMSGTMYLTKVIKGEASVVEIAMEASGYFGNNLSMDKEVLLLSMEGLLVQGKDEDGDVVVIPSDDDTEYPNISGEEYIVVNLRTKAHSTYRDGERTAVAKTASLNFGSYTDKAVSDMFILSRALGEAEVIVNTKEDVERIYPLHWGVTTQANLKNKKLPLAKGLRGSNWTISLVVPDESHLEVRGIELYVTDLKRHV